MAELVVLGSAQDGGLPHAGCLCQYCERARADRTFARQPASLGIADGEDLALIDATMAFGEQIHCLWQHAHDARDQLGGRYLPPRTILLTHAHTGHYAGLWQLDRSVLAADGVHVLAPPRMAAFLADNEPWAAMEREGFIQIASLELDMPLDVSPHVRVTPIAVPHRAEWGTETVAIRIDGPNQTVLYLPDIDAWDDWERDINVVIGSVDVALIDGCFWEPFAIPGVPHPPVRSSLDRLQPLADAGKRIVFTHLNHTNPLVDPDSPESHQVRERGFAIAHEGDTFKL
jgi:pyrroloquinoline quinone biosynthesis protein B